MGGKSQIIRDARLRFSVEANEIKRRALLYIARNATLESQVRHRAQLQLHNMEGSTRPGRVSNRCMETGRGRGELVVVCEQDLRYSCADCRLLLIDRYYESVRSMSGKTMLAVLQISRDVRWLISFFVYYSTNSV